MRGTNDKNSKVSQRGSGKGRPPQTGRSITANDTKDDITSQHSDILAICCTSNIIFCDICCFRSATLRRSSL